MRLLALVRARVAVRLVAVECFGIALIVGSKAHTEQAFCSKKCCNLLVQYDVDEFWLGYATIFTKRHLNVMKVRARAKMDSIDVS